jgi:MHS family alpha-ketoglutarate permease-like MFS transporter
VRALGVALPYAISNAVFGGTAQYIALWFKKQGNEGGFFLYVTAVIAASLVVFVFMRETKVHSRIVEE